MLSSAEYRDQQAFAKKWKSRRSSMQNASLIRISKLELWPRVFMKSGTALRILSATSWTVHISLIGWSEHYDDKSDRLHRIWNTKFFYFVGSVTTCLTNYNGFMVKRKVKMKIPVVSSCLDITPFKFRYFPIRSLTRPHMIIIEDMDAIPLIYVLQGFYVLQNTWYI